MRTSPRVVFHGMDHSDAVESRIIEEIEKLQRLNSHITDCRVTVEPPDKHHSTGAPYNVSINVNIPGETLVVGSGAVKPAHDDIYLAVRDAFATMSRRLKEHTERRNAHRG